MEFNNPLDDYEIERQQFEQQFVIRCKSTNQVCYVSLQEAYDADLWLSKPQDVLVWAIQNKEFKNEEGQLNDIEKLIELANGMKTAFIEGCAQNKETPREKAVREAHIECYNIFKKHFGNKTITSIYVIHRLTEVFVSYRFDIAGKERKVSTTVELGENAAESFAEEILRGVRNAH